MTTGMTADTTMRATARALLGASAEFHDIPAVDLDALVDMLHVESIGGGRTPADDGPPGAAWLVLEGELSTLQDDREVGHFVPGDWVGAAGLLTGGGVDLTIRAMAPSLLARLSGDARASIEADRPALRIALRRTLMRGLAAETRQLGRRISGHLAGPGVPAAEAGTEQVDVVVVGGGPIGLAYAIWLKRARPATRIVVMDRRAQPGYKVGESTLSTTVRSLRSLGLSHTMLRRLFANKLGLAFWWVGPESEKPSTHIDVIEIEETFQVERRVLEVALLQCAAQVGIDVRTDCRVDVTRSAIRAPRSTLVCVTPDGEQRVSAAVVCDASGMASVIPRAFGRYRKPPDTIDANSYFGYFKRKANADLEHWDIAATRHLCFPEGWWWFITVCSWEQMTDENLGAMIGAMFDELPSEDGDEVPTRADYAARFDAKTEEIVSIGVVVRDDLDDSKHLRPDERFDHWVRKYPGVEYILRNYERVEQPYGKHRAISVFQRMSHDLDTAVGDGWLAVGDSAFFVNPLFSPGLNFGNGTAYMAVQATIRALDTADSSRETFRSYETYIRAVGTALLRENEMLYRGFRSARSFERVLMLKFFFGITDILPRGDFSPSDPYAYNLLDPRFTNTVQQTIAIMRDGERRGEDPDVTAEKVATVVDALADWLRDQDVVRDAHIGRYFTHYTDDLRRVEDRVRAPGDFRTWRCTECRSFVEETFQRCLVCGTPHSPARA
jgi:flavin-dependent dehydrogenase